MKKILMAGTLLLLAACGSSSNGVSVGTSGDKTANTSAAGSDTTAVATDDTESGDTISVNDLNDIPPECLNILGDFLKTIEPEVSKVDWSKATLNDLEALGTQFQDDSDKFNAESEAKGCTKYDLQTGDAKTLQQLEELASQVAPGTVPFIHFIGSLSSATQTTLASAGDCDSIIAQIEPFLGTGKTIKDLTIDDATKISGLFTQLGTACPADKASAFFARDDVQAFVGS